MRVSDQPRVFDLFNELPLDEDFERGLGQYFYRSERSKGRVAVVEQGLALNPALASASLVLLLNCGPQTVGERVQYNASLTREQRSALLHIVGQGNQGEFTPGTLPDKFISFHTDNLWNNGPETHFFPADPNRSEFKREIRSPRPTNEKFANPRQSSTLTKYFLEENYSSVNDLLKRHWSLFDTEVEGEHIAAQAAAACITPYASDIEAAIHSDHYPLRVAACLNRNLFDEATAQIVTRGNRRLMRYLLWNEAVPIEKLPVGTLLPLWPLELAERRDARADLLAEISLLAIAREKNQAIIDALLIHPQLNAETFHLIVEKASHEAVEKWVRTAEIVTTDMLEHAAQKRPGQLRTYLSSHPRSKAIASEQQVVQRVWQAMEARGQPNLLDEMMNERSPRVRAVVAANTRTTSIWERLIEDRFLHVAYYAAQNPQFVAETLQKYAKESHLIHYAWLRSGTLTERQARSQIKREGEIAEYCLSLTKSPVAYSRER